MMYIRIYVRIIRYNAFDDLKVSLEHKEDADCLSVS